MTSYRRHYLRQSAIPRPTIHLKQSDEYYLVVPTLIETLRNELTLVTLYTTINRAGVVVPVGSAAAQQRRPRPG
jgi:hypothetical protein